MAEKIVDLEEGRKMKLELTPDTIMMAYFNNNDTKKSIHVD